MKKYLVPAVLLFISLAQTVRADISQSSYANRVSCFHQMEPMGSKTSVTIGFDQNVLQYEVHSLNMPTPQISTGVPVVMTESADLSTLTFSGQNTKLVINQAYPVSINGKLFFTAKFSMHSNYTKVQNDALLCELNMSRPLPAISGSN